MDLRYYGKSGMRDHDWGSAMTFAPNLARSPVFFDGELANPVRFREAISSLHDVVIGDLKFHKKDKTAYKAWLEQQAHAETKLRHEIHDKEKLAVARRLTGKPISKSLESDFHRLHSLYWVARRKWAAELSQNDPALFRALVPCDPVVTVAPDVVMFECFAKDESSYGCLSVDRDAFKGAEDAGLGTTNVDYSLALFEHFQTIRTYRPTRLLVDPAGFEVVAGSGAAATLREEKIDLPGSWLRGFGQLQAAMALPARRVELSTDVVYSLLAFMRRHREKTGPRSLKFLLTPGKPVQIEIEPFGVVLTSRGRLYDGPVAEHIKVWGRRRLMAFARALPLAEYFDVQLLGTGLPSVWVARCGEMRLTLALSGWTANDWTGGSALDQHFAGFTSHPGAIDRVARHLEVARSATLAELVGVAGEDDKVVLGSLHELAKRGQLAYDFAGAIYRWRPIMDAALSDAVLGPEPEETREGKRLVTAVKIERKESLFAKIVSLGSRRPAPAPLPKELVIGKVGKTSCEAVFDPDGVLTKAKCTCSYFHKMGLRGGPCRHLLALRLFVMAKREPTIPVARLVVQPPSRAMIVLMLTAELVDAAGPKLDDALDAMWLDARTGVATWRTAPQPSRAPRTPRAVMLSDKVVGEIQDAAARLDVSVSTIVESAWRAVRTNSTPPASRN